MPQPTDRQLLAIEKAMDHVQQQYLESGKDPMYQVRAEVFSTDKDYKKVLISDSNGKAKLDATWHKDKLGQFGFRDWTSIFEETTAVADISVEDGQPKLSATRRGTKTDGVAHTSQQLDPLRQFERDIRWRTDLHKTIVDKDFKTIVEMDLKCTAEQKQSILGMTAPRLERCTGTYVTKDGKRGKYESGNANHEVYYRKFTEAGKKPVEIMARLSEDKKDNKDVAHAWYWKGLFE